MKAKEKEYYMIIKFIVPLAKFAFISVQKLTKLRERYSICQNCTFSLASTGAMSYLFDICTIPILTFYTTLCTVRYYRDPIRLDIWPGETYLNAHIRFSIPLFIKAFAPILFSIYICCMVKRFDIDILL